MARKLLRDTEPFAVKETELAMGIEADPDATYHLRPLTVEKVREVVHAHTKQEFDPRTHRKVDVVKEVAVNDALLDYAIESWSGVSNGTAQAPCDLAHKLKLPIEVQRALLARAQVGDLAAEVREQSFRPAS